MLPSKKRIIEIFDKSACEYGLEGSPYFDYFGKQLVQYSSVRPGMKALDVACGRGAVLFPLAKALGKKGEATGIDLSSEMITELKKDPRLDTGNRVKLQVMDAETLDFSNDSFDLIYCGFAVFFFPNPEKALFELKRVLKANGKIYFSLWGEVSKFTTFLLEQCKKIKILKRISANSLANPANLEKILLETGFSKIKIEREKKLFSYSFEDWWRGVWHQGVRNYLDQLSYIEVEKIQLECLKEFSKLGAKLIEEEFEAFYIEAQS